MPQTPSNKSPSPGENSKGISVGGTGATGEATGGATGVSPKLPPWIKTAESSDPSFVSAIASLSV